ncbi:MAG: hypothetical protein AAF611_22025 [Bacteroidota bacterium]
MKKQKLNNLRLDKTSISNLHVHNIFGGDDFLTMTYDNQNTCDKDCNLLTKRKRCGAQNATEAYTCTVDSIYLSNCALPDCISATACA